LGHEAPESIPRTLRAYHLTRKTGRRRWPTPGSRLRSYVASRPPAKVSTPSRPRPVYRSRWSGTSLESVRDAIHDPRGVRSAPEPQRSVPAFFIASNICAKANAAAMTRQPTTTQC
jgi:hypothetical protein